MQDGHQIDNCIVPTNKRNKLCGIMHISAYNLYAWKHLHASRWQASGWHRDAVSLSAQCFANMATNKTAAA
jgi:hypothetical protein